MGGPFPTEIHDEVGEHLRGPRKRIRSSDRPGPPLQDGIRDIPLLRYSNQVNGAEWKLVVTKLDVLDDLAEIPICVGYEIDGKVTDEIPADVEGLKDQALWRSY